MARKLNPPKRKFTELYAPVKGIPRIFFECRACGKSLYVNPTPSSTLSGSLVFAVMPHKCTPKE